MRLPKIRIAPGPALATVRGWPKLVPRGRARVISLVLGVLVFAGASTQVAVGVMGGLPDGAVFRAGDTVVTEDEFQDRMNVLQALYGVEPPEKGPKREDFKRDAAKSVAVSSIIDRAVRDHGIVIADKEAQDTLNKMVEEQLPGGRDDLVQFLSARGVSERDVVDEVKRQLATSRLFEKVTDDVQPVTDEEVQQEFEDREDEMVAPEQRHLRNIVVDSEAQGNSIVQQIKDGMEFETLAAEHSLDQSTKDDGGDLGTVTADQLDERYAEAAFQAEEGEVFGPVDTEHGFNVGQVLEITPEEQLSFDQVKDDLEADMNSRRTLDTWRTWLGERIAEADVTYADEYRPDDPDAPPTDAPR
ncbi:peptidyl-prolyl cis-trans isomerase [Haloechinothrix sp. YIM 98757]|uniref:Peptidyl-prolyl cis-trans isomerase n=1 Tax=Haloechinothrix aidingensis TaxID=2752311 RepID=A0A838AC69_9PSEU|nr:peptidyl-prolyl cis-trans isomerase [Haloechinothrix aidingensis]MBA0126768.1 peptidyl-prolyl cis-trans isomerase [Haloechinothrix aidingensis]